MNDRFIEHLEDIAWAVLDAEVDGEAVAEERERRAFARKARVARRVRAARKAA